jgi:hypothetical protein
MRQAAWCSDDRVDTTKPEPVRAVTDNPVVSKILTARTLRGGDRAALAERSALIGKAGERTPERHPMFL